VHKRKNDCGNNIRPSLIESSSYKKLAELFCTSDKLLQNKELNGKSLKCEGLLMNCIIDHLYLSQQNKTLDPKKELCLPKKIQCRETDLTKFEGETIQLAMNLMDRLQRSSKIANVSLIIGRK
jgi:hypothetical protein